MSAIDHKLHTLAYACLFARDVSAAVDHLFIQITEGWGGFSDPVASWQTDLAAALRRPGGLRRLAGPTSRFSEAEWRTLLRDLLARLAEQQDRHPFCATCRELRPGPARFCRSCGARLDRIGALP